MSHPAPPTRTVTCLVAALALVLATACEPEKPREPRAAREGSVSDSPRAKGARSGPYRMSAPGLERIREAEAFVPRVYDDGVGNKTIGYGHMLRPGESFAGGISEAQGRELFAEDVARIVDGALDRVTVPLTQNQIDAIGSFIYNVGPGNFARSVLPALNARDYERATAAMARYSKGRNQRTGERMALRGLVKRRREEIALFNAPDGTIPPATSSTRRFRVLRLQFAILDHPARTERPCILDHCAPAPSPS